MQFIEIVIFRDPNCEGCKYKNFCDKIQKAIESVKDL